MHFRSITAFFLIFSIFSALRAQQMFFRDDSIKVFSGSGALLNPWAGGMNSTQYSGLDLDLDGKEDLVTFDKGSFKIRCFLNTGSPGISRYKHSPQFEYAFPPVKEWVIFKDYNADGLSDIFTYTSGGVKVYKNTSSLSAGLQFTLESNLIYSNYDPSGTPDWLNLYAAPAGFPAFTDVDNDGDMDILSFGVFGITVEYHQNQAVELGLSLDSLHFHMVDACWGNFSENSCSSNLNYCPLFRKWLESENKAKNSNLHAGACLTCFDNDGDGDKDLIIGDISCDSVEFFINGGSSTNANATYTTKQYPASAPVKIPYFPCTYFIDTDNDGARDLIASPNSTPASENYLSSWRYKNTGTDASPVFSFVELNFLQDSMIDFGEGAYPALVDEDGDGLPDIIAGNFGYFNNPNYNSRLALLKNTGTAANPQFSIVTRNYANFSSYGLQSMAPAFGDLDGDGDMDLIIGDYDGKLHYFKNNAGAGNPLSFSLTNSFYSGIDVGNNAMPQIVDVDRDGLKDLLVGGRNGKINYFRNTGTATAPVFSATATNNFLGSVNVCATGLITGYAAPFLMDVNGQYELLVGSERGYLYRFGNVDGNLSGAFTLIDSIGWNIWDGGRIAPAVANINNDGMQDMILGNFDGGLSYYKGDSLLSGIKKENFGPELNIFPNPATDELNIVFTDKTYDERTFDLFDVQGRLLMHLNSRQPVLKIQLSAFENGIYLLSTRNKNGHQSVKRFIISRP